MVYYKSDGVYNFVDQSGAEQGMWSVLVWIVAVQSGMVLGDGGRVVCIVSRIDSYAKGLALDEQSCKGKEKTVVVNDRW